MSFWQDVGLGGRLFVNASCLNPVGALRYEQRCRPVIA
jgi:hypothetical protein